MSDRRCALGLGARMGGEEENMCVCMWREVGGWGGGSYWTPELGGELGADARPSRDPELQSDAAFGAVVTRVWLPAPRCPAHGGLASGPGKAEQPSAGLRAKRRGGALQKDPEEEETARIGPGKRRNGAAHAEWRGRPPFRRRRPSACWK